MSKKKQQLQIRPKSLLSLPKITTHNQTQIANPKSSSIIKPKLQKKKEEREAHSGKTAARLVRVFKQQFSIFLKIRVGKEVCEKAYENMCNIV